ncbi:hypothetical protein Bca52824_013832 [Brassica carinata]|uniref:Uncharacterized protein n=1 Tax=Brassica carinata TaxID=52824 RepID=A0A8X8B1Q9_BRACI|nr:hypothetical protein Bca52824_013832 [Brassica carinata]
MANPGFYIIVNAFLGFGQANGDIDRKCRQLNEYVHETTVANSLLTFALIGNNAAHDTVLCSTSLPSDSVTRSSIYAQIGESLNGLSSIRAYKACEQMAKINGKSMDNNIRQASRAENSLNSVERVGNYIDLPSEAADVIKNNRPVSGWPSRGSIKFEDVYLRYRTGLPLILHGLSISVSQ